MKQYAVLYERGEQNWSADVPALPGCVPTGKTREEAEQRIREAIAFHIESRLGLALCQPDRRNRSGGLNIRSRPV